MTGRTSPFGVTTLDRPVRPAIHAVVAAAILAAGMFAQTEAGDADAASPASDRSADLDTTAVVNLQRHVNELRSELLDERERRIDLREEAHGAVLVVLGIVIGIGGPRGLCQIPVHRGGDENRRRSNPPFRARSSGSDPPGPRHPSNRPARGSSRFPCSSPQGLKLNQSPR